MQEATKSSDLAKNVWDSMNSRLADPGHAHHRPDGEGRGLLREERARRPVFVCLYSVRRVMPSRQISRAETQPVTAHVTASRRPTQSEIATKDTDATSSRALAEGPEDRQPDPGRHRALAGSTPGG